MVVREQCLVCRNMWQWVRCKCMYLGQVQRSFGNASSFFSGHSWRQSRQSRENSARISWYPSGSDHCSSCSLRRSLSSKALTLLSMDAIVQSLYYSGIAWCAESLVPAAGRTLRAPGLKLRDSGNWSRNLCCRRHFYECHTPYTAAKCTIHHSRARLCD